jgi:PAS domain S-box-containing protein
MQFFSFIKNKLAKDFPIHGKKHVVGRLQESEIRYRRLFESAKDGILILDVETGNIIDANPYIIKIIDFPLNEIIGRKLWEIGLFRNKEQSELAFTELKTKGYIRFEDMPIPRRNGKITEVEFISNVYLENNKKVIQCNIRDITERKLAEEAMKESEQNLKKQNADYIILNNRYTILNEELTQSLNHIQKINDELNKAKVKAEESDKLKSAFLANMSHEIRTPMNAIMGFSDFLLQPDLPKEKLESFVQIINASCLQLMSVISDIIDISKIESGQITIEPELVDVNRIMDELLETYKKAVELKNLRLLYSCSRPNEVIQIKTDGNRIKQVICNLMNNALKFTTKGEIEFGYTLKEDFIEFYVKDTGIGIASENHALVFQRFRQVEKTNYHIYGGNGLGLSISKALVEKLGGSITVNSILGQGSTFTFTIPYVTGIENVAIPLLKGLSDKYNWEGKTILLVEDEANNHAYIQELLSITKANIIHAWDGSQAVEHVKKCPDISLVLMDIKMPIMDGYEATRLIKEIRPTLPVVAQTAYALGYNKKQALDAGCDNYFAKPIERKLFMQTLDAYFN